MPGTQSGLDGALDGTMSVSLRGRVFRSGLSPDGRDTHFQTLVRRPPTPDTGRAPGPDAVRRQVRDKRQIRALLPHVSHKRVSLPLRLNMESQSFDFQIGRVKKALVCRSCPRSCDCCWDHSRSNLLTCSHLCTSGPTAVGRPVVLKA